MVYDPRVIVPFFLLSGFLIPDRICRYDIQSNGWKILSIIAHFYTDTGLVFLILSTKILSKIPFEVEAQFLLSDRMCPADKSCSRVCNTDASWALASAADSGICRAPTHQLITKATYA
jgi:hypothetical protein